MLKYFSVLILFRILQNQINKIMIELLPQEKSRLRYLRLFEEQLLWNAKKQEPKTFLTKLIKWMSVK